MQASQRLEESVGDRVDDRLLNGRSVSVTFADVQDSLRPFTGDDSGSIVKWVEDFEDLASLCSWSELHKFIYGKRLLQGTALDFVRGESGLRSWSELRDRLLNEFRCRLSTADVHRQLSSRRKRADETLLQYLYKMREIAAHGNIEDESVIDYVICGVPDTSADKNVLYGAATLGEFKKKIELYERIRSRSQAGNVPQVTADGKPKPTIASGGSSVEGVTRCFNCGDRGHQSRECPDVDKGPKCFSCRAFGHKSFECPGKSDAVPNVYQVDYGSNNDRIVKPVVISGCEALALIDTGCDINICRHSIGLKLVNATSKICQLRLRGPAGTNFFTEQVLDAELYIDGRTYPITVYTVSDDSIGHDVIIGRTLFQTSAELRVGPKAVEVVDAREVRQMMAIDVEVPELDVGERKFLPTIKKIVSNYVPESRVTVPMKTVIILSDEVPVYQRPRRLAPREKVAVDRQVEEWLSEGIIRHSCSDYASPVVLVAKKDGTLRLCIDYRALNKKIVRDRYPLPLIDEQVDRLRDAVIFSTLDLRNGFFHVPMDENSIRYTSFVTPSGQYEFLRTPFGLCISPPVFQRYVNFVFRDMIKAGYLLAYMDDLVVVAANVDEGVARLEAVMGIAAEYGLDIKWSKCQFLKRTIDYLGYRIQYNAVSPSEDKLSAVRHFPIPKTVKAVQSFLGLTGYFRRFIAGYAHVARPLSDLLKQDVVFRVDVEQEAAFVELKRRLTEAPVLRIYSPEAEATELHTDASQWGFGAVLLQKDSNDGKLHPVCYMSRKTTEAQRNYHSYELEVLAIVEALKKFRVYLLGMHFKIVTDCAAFTKTLEKKDLATRVARWALLVSEYDYTIEHRSGSRMPHVDSLSRYPVCMSIQRSEFLLRLVAAQQGDPDVRTIMNTPVAGKHVIKGGILHEVCDGNDLPIIPKNMQTEIIRNAHNIGHFGVTKTESLVRREYSIVGLKEKIESVIRNCVPCILMNRKQGRQEGFLHPIDKGDAPLMTWHIDFLGPMEATSKGYKHILAVIDGFSKFCWLFPTKSTAASEVIDRLALLEVTFGNPERIVSDRGTAFTSHSFEQYCKDRNIRHISITTGMPRGNGQVERLNSIIINVLAKMCIDQPGKWYRQVGKVQMAINGSVQRSIGMTPFKLTFGVEMRHADFASLKEAIEKEYINWYESQREEDRQRAKDQIAKAQEEQRKTFNKRRKESEPYRIGDLVAIRRTQFLPMSKLAKKYLGPYRIVSRRGPNRFEVWKVGDGEGPNKTSTGTDFMKPWCPTINHEEEDAAEADAVQSGEDVELNCLLERGSVP